MPRVVATDLTDGGPDNTEIFLRGTAGTPDSSKSTALTNAMDTDLWNVLSERDF